MRNASLFVSIIGFASFLFAQDSVAPFHTTFTYDCGNSGLVTVTADGYTPSGPWNLKPTDQRRIANCSSYVAPQDKPAPRVVTPKRHKPVETPPAFAQSTPPLTPAVNSQASSESGMAGFSAILLFLAVIAYIFPIAVASHRKCKAAAGIAVVNLFLGWTFVGWVVALAWAASGEQRRARPA